MPGCSESRPFCWWIGVVMDHFSRRIVGLAVFKGPPTSEAMRTFVGRTIAKVGATPKYLICDKGKQFWCHAFKSWARHKGIRLRFGAVGQYGSLAVLERLILTLKSEGTRPVALVPFLRSAFRHEVQHFVTWYNQCRPHMALAGRTPDEVYANSRAANRCPRFEPRPRWPRGSPCALPQALVKGAPGIHLQMQVACLSGGRHLPVIMLRRAA